MGKHLVDLGNGRKLNMVCMGRGSPTLVFELGLGGNQLHWKKVAVPAAEISRACFYDRAGYGFSDPMAGPLTGTSVTDDLDLLLARSGEKGPFVLVAHSLGGLYATLFADRFADQVAGLVLIDPSYADQDKGEGPNERADDAKHYPAGLVSMRKCEDLAKAGKLTRKKPDECFQILPGRSPREIDFLARQFFRPYRWASTISEAESMHAEGAASSEDSIEEKQASRSFGSLPIIVLTAGRQEDWPGIPQEELDASRAAWKEGHDHLAARSSRGESLVVPDAGHGIQLDQPGAVIDAIRKVVSEARGN